MRSRIALAVVAVSMIGGGLDAAYAAHLQQVDVQPHRELSPAPAQSSASTVCDSIVSGDNFFDFGFNFVRLKSFSAGSGTSNDPSCTFMSKATDTQEVTVTIVPDVGEPAGAPVTLCINFEQFLRVSSTGALTGESSVGGSGNPTADPLQVIRNPGSLVLFTEGPTNISSASEHEVFDRQISAAIGDMIDMRTGTEVQLNAAGVGSVSANATVLLGLSLGSCVATGAPAMSHTGLAGLAVALGIGGTVLIRRRRARVQTR